MSGIDLGETSVSKYLVRHRKPPSQAWRTSIENHVKSLVSVELFTVPKHPVLKAVLSVLLGCHSAA